MYDGYNRPAAPQPPRTPPLRRVRRRRRFRLLPLLVALCLIVAAIPLGKAAAAKLRDYVERIRCPLSYRTLIMSASETYGVPPDIIAAVINTESSFDPSAVSSAGAVGLMQLMPDTFAWLLTKTGETYSGDALTDPETNIRYGTYLLSMLYGEFGVWDTAFAAYNAGVGRVRSWIAASEDGTLKDIPIAESRSYVVKVDRDTEVYRRLYFS